MHVAERCDIKIVHINWYLYEWTNEMVVSYEGVDSTGAAFMCSSENIRISLDACNHHSLVIVLLFFSEKKCQNSYCDQCLKFQCYENIAS